MEVMIVDDHPIFRIGICAVLQEAALPAIRAVRYFSNQSSLHKFLKTGESIGVAILSYRFSHMIPEIMKGRTDFDQPRIILIVGRGWHHSLTAGQLGVDAIIDREVGRDEFINIMRMAVQGQAIVNHAHTETEVLMEESRQVAKQLSVKEKKIVAAIMQGEDYRQIARDYQLQIPSLKNLMGRIFDRVGVNHRMELVAWIMRHPPFARMIGVDPGKIFPYLTRRQYS